MWVHNTLDTTTETWTITGVHNTLDTTTETWTITGVHNTLDTTTETWTITGVHNTLDTTTETWTITGVHNTLDTATETWTITGVHNTLDTATETWTITGVHNTLDTTTETWTITGVPNTLDTTTETWTITGVHNTLDTATETWTITWQQTNKKHTQQQQQIDISLTWQESCDWACVACWTSAQGSGRWTPGMWMMCDVCRPWSGDPRQAALRTSHSGNPARTQPHKMHMKPPAQCSAQIQNSTFTLSATLWRTQSIRLSYVTLHVVSFALNNCCWGFSY